MKSWLIPMAAGFGAGILSAWGVGGGTLLLLVMTLILGVPQQQAAEARAEEAAGDRRLQGAVVEAVAPVDLHRRDQEDHEQDRPHDGEGREHFVHGDLEAQLADAGMDVKAVEQQHDHLDHHSGGDPQQHLGKRAVLQLLLGHALGGLGSDRFDLVFLHISVSTPNSRTGLPCAGIPRMILAIVAENQGFRKVSAEISASSFPKFSSLSGLSFTFS